MPGIDDFLAERGPEAALLLFDEARPAGMTLDRATEVIDALTRRFDQAEADKDRLEVTAQLFEPDSIEAGTVLAAKDSAAFERLEIRLRQLGVSDKLCSRYRSECKKRQRLSAVDSHTYGAHHQPLYGAYDGCMVHWKGTGYGAAPTPLCDFEARISTEIHRDDGEERKVIFEIVGRHKSGRKLPAIRVPAEEFGSMKWVLALWGSAPVIAAGPGARDHLRAAIQTMSSGAKKAVVYTHLGWRNVETRWVYLHSGGAIDGDGLTERVAVEPPNPLRFYNLPAPSHGKELQVAIRASLAALTVAQLSQTVPLLAAMLRAVLGPTDFTLHIVGPSGAGKTAIAAIFLQHFGSELNARNVPASWSSTANALEALAFHAKDSALLVDDFAPTGSQFDVQRFHRDADRFLRAQGNQAGRQRMAADASLKGAKTPRCTVVSTGEDIPRGQSLRARMLIIEFAPGDVDFDLLSKAQSDADDGLYASTLSSFVAWLAPQYERIQVRLKSEIAEVRDELRGSNCHRRTPEIFANLFVGFRLFIQFAEEAGAITPTESEQLTDDAWKALQAAAASQEGHQVAGDPVPRFVELLAGAIASGRAHVASGDGNVPADPESWGWRTMTNGSGEHPRSEWQPKGERVGWIEEDGLYLEPEAAFAVVQDLGKRQGEALAVTARILHKRLDEADLLVSRGKESGRQTLKVRKILEGVRRSVLHLRTACLSDKLAPVAGDRELTRLGGPG